LGRPGIDEENISRPVHDCKTPGRCPISGGGDVMTKQLYR